MEKHRILIVENEEFTALELKSRLEALGYSVCGKASNEQEAIELALALSPDIILMDIRLENEDDGIEAAKKIQANRNIPIMYLTAYGDQQTLDRAKETNPYGYLTKPVQEKDLRISLDLALHKIQIEKEVQKRREVEEQVTKLSTAVEQSPVTIVITDIHGDIEYGNPRFTQLTGYKVEEVAGKNPRFLKSDYHSKEFYENLWDTITSGEIWKGEFYNKKKDGSFFWEEATIAPILNSQDEITGYVAIKQDITERKRFEEILKEKEEKYRALFESNIDPVCIIDAKTLEVVDVNSAFTTIYGYSHDEIIGKPYLTVSAEPEATKTSFVFARQKGYSRVSKRTHIKKDGTKLFVEGNDIRFITEGREMLFNITHDISRRLQSQMELEEREKKFRTFFTSDLIGMAELSIAKEWIGFNDKFADILGYTPKELKQKTLADITHEKDLATENQLFNRVITHQVDGYSIEKRFITKSSEFRDCKVIVKAIKTTVSTISHLILLVDDITDKKRAEREIVLAKEKAEQNELFTKKQNEEIEDNNERLESLLRISQIQTNNVQELLDYALHEAITLTKSKIGYIYFYNEQARQFILNSWSKDVMKECTVVNPQTVYNLDDTGCWGEAVRQRKPIIINDYQAENQYKKGTPEGHVKLSKFLTIPVFADGKIVAVTGVANKELDYDQSDVRQLTLLMDSVWRISERISLMENLKQAKAKAQESETKFRILVDNVPGVIFRCLNDPSWTMIYLSHAIEELVGYPATDFINGEVRTFTSIIHPDYREEVDNAIQKSLKEKTPYSITYKVVCCNENRKWVREIGQGVFGKGGDLMYIDGVITDITEMVNAQEKVSQSEAKLKELNSTKDKFFSIIGHDLKNPFNALINFSEILLESKEKLSEAELNEVIKMINAVSKNTHSLLVNLLDWAKSQAGTMQIKKEDFDLRELSNIVYEQLNEVAENKKITIINEIPNWVIVYADKNMIKTTIRNLISNAIKFTKEGGSIKITTKKLNDYVEVSVTDTGIGMNEKTKNSLFKIEETSSLEGTSGEIGTGLGLILCKEFIEKNSGKIWVESELEKGSRFTFSLIQSYPSDRSKRSNG